MAGRVEILHLAIVRPLVRDVKRRRDRAAVRIFTAVFEQIAVQRPVQVVYGVVEREQNDLRQLLDRYTTCVRVITVSSSRSTRTVDTARGRATRSL